MSAVKDLYTTFKAELTVMSPVFIGSGDVLNKTRYYFDRKSNLVKIVDDKKFRAFLAKNDLFDSFQKHLVKFGKKGNLATWLFENNIRINSVDIFKYELPLSVIKSKDLKTNPLAQLNDIKMFVKNSDGMPYIPGSSIKGAIRTALLYLELKNNKDKYSHYWNRLSSVIEDKNLKKELENIIKDIEGEVFGSIKDSRFKALRISDSNGLTYEDLHVAQRGDFPIHKAKVSAMSIFFEILNVDSKFNFNVEIDEHLNKDKYFTKEKIEEALASFAKHQNNLYNVFAKKDLDRVYMPDEISDDVEPNLCLGGSSGFWSKTVVYALAPNKESAINILSKYLSYSFDRMKHKHAELDRKHQTAPHTMKLIDVDGDYLPIGWCDFKIIERS